MSNLPPWFLNCNDHIKLSPGTGAVAGGLPPPPPFVISLVTCDNSGPVSPHLSLPHLTPHTSQLEGHECEHESRQTTVPHYYIELTLESKRR